MRSSGSSKPKKKRTTETISTLLEVYGLLILAGGLAMFRLWVGVAVLGAELILMGVALGMSKPATSEPDEVA